MHGSTQNVANLVNRAFFTFKVVKVKKYIICKKCIPMEFVKIDKISSKAFTALVANKIELI